MRVRLLFVLVVGLASSCAMEAQRAQDGAFRTQKALEVVRKTLAGEIRLADYGDGQGIKFADAKLSAETKQEIATSIPDDFFAFPYEGSTRDALNSSIFHSLGAFLGGNRLCWLLFRTGGSNGAIAIVEFNAHKARLLEEASGWGLRAIPMPGELYPILVVP